MGKTINTEAIIIGAGDEHFTVKAGDRMPYFLIDGESIYDKLRRPKFHLLFFSNAGSDFQALKTELDSQYAELVDVKIIPPDAQAAGRFGTDKAFYVLLRPDNYIGFISPDISSDGVRIYLDKFVGHS